MFYKHKILHKQKIKKCGWPQICTEFLRVLDASSGVQGNTVICKKPRCSSAKYVIFKFLYYPPNCIIVILSTMNTVLKHKQTMSKPNVALPAQINCAMIMMVEAAVEREKVETM